MKKLNYFYSSIIPNLATDFKDVIKILIKILGDENKKETGMFTNYYWLMPIGKYVEKYGLESLSETCALFDLKRDAYYKIIKFYKCITSS